MREIPHVRAPVWKAARPKFSKWDFVVERGGDDWGKEQGMEGERKREREIEEEKLAFATLSLLSFEWVSEWVKHFFSSFFFLWYFVTLTFHFLRDP
jgi:hypothetical protein